MQALRNLLLIVWAWLKAAFTTAREGGRNFFLVRTIDSFSLGFVALGLKGAGKTSIIVKILNKAWAEGDAVIAVDTGDHIFERAKLRVPPGTPVYLHDVTRKDGYGVDLAKLVDTEPRILDFADKVIQSTPGSRNEFWTSSGKGLLIAKIRCLNHFAPREWRPFDLCWLASNRKLFEAVCAETKGAVFNPLAVMVNGQAGHDVVATVQSAMLPMMHYMALCDHLPLHSPLDVAQSRKGTVVLRWADLVAPALEKMYAVVLDVCGTEGLSAVCPERRLWFSCDEIRSLARMQFPKPMALRGRRAKCNLLISVHEIDGLWDRYGKDLGNEIIGVMGIKAFLRLGGTQTVQFAADTMSRIEFLRGIMDDRGDIRWGVLEKYNVDPSRFLTIPYPDPDADRLVGVSTSPDHRGWFVTKFVNDTNLDPSTIVPGEPCPMEWYAPPPRGEADLRRLNIPLTDAVLRAIRP